MKYINRIAFGLFFVCCLSQHMQASHVVVEEGSADAQNIQQNVNTIISAMITGNVRAIEGALPPVEDMVRIEKYKTFIKDHAPVKDRFLKAYNTLSEQSGEKYKKSEEELLRIFGPRFILELENIKIKFKKFIKDVMKSGEIKRYAQLFPEAEDIEELKKFIMGSPTHTEEFRTAYEEIAEKADPEEYPGHSDVFLELINFGPAFFQEIGIDLNKPKGVSQQISNAVTDAVGVGRQALQSMAQGLRERFESIKERFSIDKDQTLAKEWDKVSSPGYDRTVASSLPTVAAVNTKFLDAIKKNNMTEALVCLAENKIDIFDKTTDNKNVFDKLITLLNKTAKSEIAKRNLILFCLSKIYLFSLDNQETQKIEKIWNNVEQEMHKRLSVGRAELLRPFFQTVKEFKEHKSLEAEEAAIRNALTFLASAKINVFDTVLIQAKKTNIFDTFMQELDSAYSSHRALIMFVTHQMYQYGVKSYHYERDTSPGAKDLPVKKTMLDRAAKVLSDREEIFNNAYTKLQQALHENDPKNQ